MGWDKLDNRALLDAAERPEIDLLLTTDRRIRFQQNLFSRNSYCRLVRHHKVVAGSAPRAANRRRSGYRAAAERPADGRQGEAIRKG
jgi:hypothetical protein